MIALVLIYLIDSQNKEEKYFVYFLILASEYVGSTARTLGCRISEHKGVSYRTGARLSQPSHSAVRAHSEQCDVRIRDENFRYLSKF